MRASCNAILGRALLAAALLWVATPGLAQDEGVEQPAPEAVSEPTTDEFSDGFEDDAFEDEFGSNDDEDFGADGKGRTFRIGFWVFDLFAVDVEPKGTTFRMLDFRIFKLLEIGSGEKYHSFSLVELPYLLNLATTRSDGLTYEHRLLDVQAVDLAIARHRKASPKDAETHVLKIPIVGSAYGRDVQVTQPDDESPEEIREREMVLYVFRHEVDRPEL